MRLNFRSPLAKTTKAGRSTAPFIEIKKESLSMINMTYRFALFFAGLAASQLALSQSLEPGWTVTWGPAPVPVPVGPVVPILSGLLLLGAAYSFLRKRQGQGLMALALAVIFGGFAINRESMANSIPIILMNSSYGTGSESCEVPNSASGVEPLGNVNLPYYYFVTFA